MEQMGLSPRVNEWLGDSLKPPPRARVSRFANWGLTTDGPGTPWAEWYDLDKLLSMFAPARFEVVLYQEFHNGDFNWFDLRYRGI
jgi:hypothetical protein